MTFVTSFTKLNINSKDALIQNIARKNLKLSNPSRLNKPVFSSKKQGRNI